MSMREKDLGDLMEKKMESRDKPLMNFFVLFPLSVQLTSPDHENEGNQGEHVC